MDVAAKLKATGVVQETVNIAGLSLLILRKFYLQAWLFAGIWELQFGESSHHSQN